MPKKNKHNGYRIVIVPEDGRESTTISMGPGKFLLIPLSISAVVLLFIVSIVVLVNTSVERKQLKELRSEFDVINAQAGRVAKVEQNIVEMDRYIRYIRLAMSLRGDEQPPVLEDFLANDSLRKSYELTAGAVGLTNIPNIIPVIGGHETKGFSAKNGHYGIDYAYKEGAVIRATAKGLVIETSVHEDLGKVISIDHGNGFVTKYAHCRELVAQKGKTVERGETIATVGNSGKSSSGPHLHYEIRKDGEPVDPREYIVKGL